MFPTVFHLCQFDLYVVSLSLIGPIILKFLSIRHSSLLLLGQTLHFFRHQMTLFFIRGRQVHFLKDQTVIPQSHLE